jgi:hypothetical protein
MQYQHRHATSSDWDRDLTNVFCSRHFLWIDIILTSSNFEWQKGQLKELSFQPLDSIKLIIIIISSIYIDEGPFEVKFKLYRLAINEFDTICAKGPTIKCRVTLLLLFSLFWLDFRFNSNTKCFWNPWFFIKLFSLYSLPSFYVCWNFGSSESETGSVLLLYILFQFWPTRGWKF